MRTRSPGLSNEAFARIVAGAAIVIFLGGAVSSSYRGRFFQAVKHLASWAAMLVSLVALYAYRGELAMVADRVIGELSPQGSQINVTGAYGAGQAVRIKRGWTGTFRRHCPHQGQGRRDDRRHRRLDHRAEARGR